MPLADVVEEAKRIVIAAEEQKLVLRVIGGLAVNLHCPSTKLHRLSRKYPDIDFFSYAKLSMRLQHFFQEIDYEPAKMFNALQGNRMLLFIDAGQERRIDVFLDVFQMCHRIDLRKRLELDKWTLTPADLLVTKLQVIEINEKDYVDAIALLLDHDIVDRDEPDTINGRYLSRLCSNDWGIYKTLTRNLGWVSDSVEKYVDNKEAVELVRSRIRSLLDMIERQPKSVRWTLRAAVGEKVPWYELPDARH